MHPSARACSSWNRRCELAAQVETAFRDYSRFSDIRTTVVYGGVGYGQQLKELKAGTDVLVATRGD